MHQKYVFKQFNTFVKQNGKSNNYFDLQQTFKILYLAQILSACLPAHLPASLPACRKTRFR